MLPPKSLQPKFFIVRNLLFILLSAVSAMGEHRQRQSQITECQFARGIIIYEHSFLFETKGRIGSCL